MLIQWPNSQTCCDCLHALWITESEYAELIYPACVCQHNLKPVNGICASYSDICNALTVDLMASGYEWTCPGCHCNNQEIEVKDYVKCSHCERMFKVEAAEHALE